MVNGYHNSVRYWLLLFPLYKWGSWGLERLHDWPRLANSTPGILKQASDFGVTFSTYCWIFQAISSTLDFGTHSYCATGTCLLSSCFLALPPQQCDFDARQYPTMGHLKVVSFLPQQFPQSDISVSVQGPLCSKLGIIFDIPTSNHRVNSSSPTWLLLLLFLLFLMILCQFPVHETDDLWVWIKYIIILSGLSGISSVFDMLPKGCSIFKTIFTQFFVSVSKRLSQTRS